MLFDKEDLESAWQKEWKDMPEFVQKDLQPSQQIIINFESFEDVKSFSKLIGQKLTPHTKSIWFPAIDREKPSEYIYTQE